MSCRAQFAYVNQLLLALPHAVLGINSRMTTDCNQGLGGRCRVLVAWDLERRSSF